MGIEGIIHAFKMGRDWPKEEEAYSDFHDNPASYFVERIKDNLQTPLLEKVAFYAGMYSHPMAWVETISIKLSDLRDKLK